MSILYQWFLYLYFLYLHFLFLYFLYLYLYLGQAASGFRDCTLPWDHHSQVQGSGRWWWSCGCGCGFSTLLISLLKGGTAYRGVKLNEAILLAPTGGWAANKFYIAVNPTAEVGVCLCYENILSGQ